MPSDSSIVLHHQQVITWLIKDYLEFTEASAKAYDDLTYLLLGDVAQLTIDKHLKKFLEPIAYYLHDAKYQAFIEATIFSCKAWDGTRSALGLWLLAGDAAKSLRGDF